MQLKAFERSTKRAPQLPHLSSTSIPFSNIASNECWEIFFSRIVPDILPINLWYGYLFAYINNIQMVLIKVAVCLLVYNTTYHDRLFVHTGDKSVFFSSLKNGEFLMF